MNATTAAANLIEQYMDTFSERELRGYAIAKNHFGKFFQIEETVGYKKWLKEHKIPTLTKCSFTSSNLVSPLVADVEK